MSSFLYPLDLVTEMRNDKLESVINPRRAAPGYTLIAGSRRNAPDGGSQVYPAVKKKKFKIFNGNDSDIFVVIVEQYSSA